MSNKTSDKNVGSIEEDVKIIHKIISFYKDLDTLHGNDKCKEIQALENILAEREQDKKYIKNLELALKIINKVTDIDETKEENVALLKEVLRMLDDAEYGRYEV